MNSAMKMMWIIWAALLAALAGYAALCLLAAVNAIPNLIMIRVLSIVAAAEVIAIFVLRRAMLMPAAALLMAQPENPSLLARWKGANIATWALCSCLGLYGVVLRFLGSTFTQAAPFLISSFVLLLFYYPRRPVPAT
jgi:hypothetical protein